MRTSLVLFDIDGTLLAERDMLNWRAWAGALVSMFGLRGASIDDAEHAGMTDLGTLRAVLLHHTLVDEAADPARLAATLEIKDLILERLLDLAGASARLRPCVGAVELVTHLHACGMALGVVTGNTQFAAHAKLRRMGLDPAWFTASAYGNQSIERELLVAAAVDVEVHRSPGLSPADVVVIGDTVRDVEAARSAGVRSLAVASGRASLQVLRAAAADKVLRDLTPTTALCRWLGVAPPRGTIDPEATFDARRRGR